MSQLKGMTTRRGIMLAAAAGLAATGADAAPRTTSIADLKKEADAAAAYHCDFGDAARFGQTLTNISNHYAAYGADPFAIQIVIVAHAAGIKFFLNELDGTPWKDDAVALKLFERVEAQAKNGLKILLCETTFKVNNVDKSKARDVPFIQFVPSGVATVAALQAKGFAYVKIG